MNAKTDSKQDLIRIDIRNPQPCKVVMDRLFRGDTNALVSVYQLNHNKLQATLQVISGNSNEVA